VEKFEKLPLAEETVMLALWNLEEPSTAAALTQYLAEEEHWSLTTVCSFLKRLEDRGYVARTRQGRSFVYAPTLTLDAYRSQLAAELLTRFFGGSPNQMVQVLRQEHLLSEAVPRNIPDFLL